MTVVVLSLRRKKSCCLSVFVMVSVCPGQVLSDPEELEAAVVHNQLLCFTDIEMEAVVLAPTRYFDFLIDNIVFVSLLQRAPWFTVSPVCNYSVLLGEYSV